MLKKIVKGTFNLFGLHVEWRDRLVEIIPASYTLSPYLPRIHKRSIERLLYFYEMLSQVHNVEGDIVECGVSVGYGLLEFILLSESIGTTRTFYGFDSFEGFPEPTQKDSGTHTYKGYLKTPPEIVLRVLQDGRVGQDIIHDKVKLIKGFFEETVPNYNGKIALLHLDCDLYESYRVCLEHLYKKVSYGGVILFDEYEDPNFPGARKAVDEFFVNKPKDVIRRPNFRLYEAYVIKKSE